MHDNSVHFENGIRLKDESAPPSHRKIYPLDQEELAKLKKQIVDMLSKTRLDHLIAHMGHLYYLRKRRMLG